MKMLRKILSALLVLVLVLQCGGSAFAAGPDEYSEYSEDGVKYTYNADGTVTATVMVTPAEAAPAKRSLPEADSFTDAGDSFVNSSDSVSISLDKVYSDGRTLVSMESEGLTIDFYPETASGEEAEPEPTETPVIEIPAPIVTEAPIVELPEPAATEPPATEISEPIATEPPATEISEPVATEPPATEISEPVATEPPAAEISEPIATEPPAAEISEPVATEPPLTEIPEPVATEAPALEESGEADAWDEPVQIYSSVTGYGAGGANGVYSAVIYPGAINEFTDIELIPNRDGVKENIVMRRYTTARMSYVLELGGLSPVLSGNAVLLYDGGGQLAGEISAPYLVDAAGGYNDNIAVSLENVGNGYRLSYAMDEAWLKAAAYPVTLDPTVKYTGKDGEGHSWNNMEDAYVSSGSPNTNYGWTSWTLRCGNTNGESLCLFRPVFPGSINDIADYILVKEVKLHTYVESVTGANTYSLYQLLGDWNSKTITYNNCPAYVALNAPSNYIASAGWYTWDLTTAASTWFNSLAQMQPYGVLIRGESSGGSLVFASSDPYYNNAYYTITYYPVSKSVPKDPGLELSAAGNGQNSGTGSIDLSWSEVEGAENYYVGIHNGKEFEYFYVNDATSWSTAGKGIWPTETEIAEGRYALHHDGLGAELPMIPAFSYANSGGELADSLYYSLCVVPANEYGQAPNPKYFSVKSTRLPDTLPPSQATELSIEPGSYTNADEIELLWSGIMDFNAVDTEAVASLGTGKLQYSLDDTSQWQNTTSSQGSDSAAIDVSALSDGRHVLYIRAEDSAGNVSTPQPVYFYIDRTAPTMPMASLVPSDWSREDSLSLSWSGISDANELSRVEYAIDGGEYIDTGMTQPAYSAFIIDSTSFADGEHSLSLRAIDAAGNVGEALSLSFRRDTTAPALDNLSLSPDGITNEDSITLNWAGLEDAHSGMGLVRYSIDGGETKSIEPSAGQSADIDISALEDGEHNILLHFEDKVTNSFEQTLSFTRDASAPELSIISPAEGAAVSGASEILGSISDYSLSKWRLEAIDEEGTSHLLASGTEPADSSLLGVLNCALFEDGEKLSLRLWAQDEAGNEAETTGTLVVVDRSAVAISAAVEITAPATGSVISTASAKGSYTLDSEQAESSGYVYIDGVYCGESSGKAFDFDAIRYDEGSAHSISIISQTADGSVHFSGGLSTAALLSDAFADASFLEEYSGVEINNCAVCLPGEDGLLLSLPVSIDYPALALELSVIEDKPEGTEISYYYSADNGDTWLPIKPGKYVPMLSRPESVQLKAELSSSAGAVPTLYGWTLSAVTESSPTRVTVRLLRKAENIALAATTAEKAVTVIAQTPVGSTALYQYINGTYKSDSFSFDARSTAENETLSAALLAETESGTLYGTGAKSALLLRETLDCSGGCDSGVLTMAEPIYALRLEALYSGVVSFCYSLDGSTWLPIAPGEYTVLESPAEKLWLHAQADSGWLEAWHIEGVSCAERNITVRIMKAPANVSAADWGADYYANEKLRCYELSWTDPAPADETAAYTTEYEIYRNGVPVAKTGAQYYRDENYLPNARYEVRTLRHYDGGTHYSARSAAVSIPMKAPQRPIGVDYTAQEQKQSEYLDKLYGGGYTFGSGTASNDDRTLDKTVLGRNKICAYGFEPVNFNNGNFLLETIDGAWADLGMSEFSLDRSYNTRSNAVNGPFGAGWSSTWTQHLLINTDGSIVHTGTDGAETLFTLSPNGTYAGGESSGLRLETSADGREYLVSDLEGHTYAFTGLGLLKYAQWRDGSRISVERSADGLICGFKLPGGTILKAESDAGGHITAVATLGGSMLTYTYTGNELSSFTDAAGRTTRYVYDAEGRMTEWYDAAGVRQVKNSYDDNDRVIHQIDANGGEYTLSYMGDHTLTLDADGNESSIWYDEQGRTVKTVDANGGETLYSYDANDNIISITDPMGNTTRYEYDAFGNKILETAPDGSSYSLRYDENNSLVQVTDQLGGITSYEYDSENRLIKQTDPDGGVSRFAYDSNDRLISETDPMGAVTSYEYDGARLMRCTDPLGNTESYAYDSENRLVSVTDALGNATAFVYDEAGRLVRADFADGSSFFYEYNALDELISETDALGNTTRYEYDALGRLVRSIYPDGSEESMSYDYAGNMTSRTDALGSVTAYSYDGMGRLISLTDALGNVTACEYDLNGALIKTTAPNGGITTYSYTPTGLISGSVDPSGEQTVYSYDAAGRLLSLTAPDGGISKYSYDSMGRLISETDPKGAVTAYAYDKSGRLLSVTDALGNLTSYAYDAAGNLLCSTDALGNETSCSYDALGRLISQTDPLGAVTRYEYNAVGELISQTDALGNVTRYEYDLNGGISALTNALGGKTSMSYDALGNISSILGTNGGLTAAEYDPAGRLISETDPMGSATSYEYDALGNVTAVTDALGRSAELSYDALGALSSVLQSDGSSISYEYDLSGRLIKERSASGSETVYTYERGRLRESTLNGRSSLYEYDPAGNISAVVDAEGRRVEFGYDALNNLTGVLYPDGTQESYEYDALSRLIKYIPRQGEAVSYAYNAMGDLLSVTEGEHTTLYEYDLLGRNTAVISPDGARSGAEFDALGNLTAETDALGNVTAYSYTADSLLREVRHANGAVTAAEYDLNGRVISETDPLGAVTSYEYDAVGHMVSLTDALGAVTRYDYDAADMLRSVTDALGNLTSYTYDASGNLLSETDALGNTVSYTYSPEGWLETVTDAEGNTTRYSYDATGNILSADYAGEQTHENSYNEIGLLTTVTTAEGVTEYQYDDASRLVSVKQPNGDVVSYTYDGYGNRSSMTYPNGKTVEYEYDEMDRLVSVTGLDGSTTRYTYDAMGQRISTDGAKEDTVYTYDALGNVISQVTSGSYCVSLSYTYDLAGRIVSESRSEKDGTVESRYAYDALGQLTDFSRGDYAESYTYDPVGNMLSKSKNGEIINYAYNAANQLVSDGTNEYIYDLNGSLTEKNSADSSVRYAYDALNRLESWTDGSHSESYSYNAAGLLSRIEDNTGLTTTLTWDILYGEGVVISAAQNGTETSFDYGLERISAVSGNDRTEFVYDGRGSVIAELSYNNAWYTLRGALSGKDAVTKAYTPFGEQAGEQSSGFGFNGEYYNAATGQVYLRARFYEPEMNRFSQKDILRGSISDALSLNRYTYCLNDPVNLTDPSGESIKTLLNSAKSFVTAVSTTYNIIKSEVKTIANTAVETVISTAANTAVAAKATVQTTKTAVVNSVKSSIKNGDSLKQTVTNAVQAGATSLRIGAVMTAAIATSGANSIQQTVSTGVNAVKATVAGGWNNVKSTGKEFLAQAANAIANCGLKKLDELSDQYPLIFGFRPKIWIENYINNTEIGIPAGTIINDQFCGTDTGIDKYRYGNSYMKNTGCEVIAVSNALTLMDINASIADLALEFQITNGVTSVPFVVYGQGGSNPYSAGDVLRMNGQDYTIVNSILGMQQEGVYIMSYWNNNNALTFEGLHGIAVQVYADGTVQTYNKGEMGPDETISFSDFISEHENGYIIGYYLGNPSENGEN